MTNHTKDEAPEVHVRHRPDGWVLPDYTDLADCTTNHRPDNSSQPPCTNTAAWRVVEDHGMHLTISFWCDTHLPDENRRPTVRPASHCPNATHTLTWGTHPHTTTQGWILRGQHPDHGTTVLATLNGYPVGRPPVYAHEAHEWADQILDSPQAWVEQPARSGAWHTHHTVDCNGHPA